MDENTRARGLAANMRFFGDLRFKQLTLLMGVLAISATGVSQYGERCLADRVTVRLAVACLAMLFTGVTWIMEVRSTLHWIVQREAAPEVWPRHHSKRFAWLNSTNAAAVFLAVVYLFWLYCAWQWYLTWPFLVLFGILWAVLVIFSVSEYWYLGGAATGARQTTALPGLPNKALQPTPPKEEECRG